MNVARTKEDAMARQTLEELERRRDQLDARIREMRAREAKAERDARNKWHHVIAGDVEAALGDWRLVDLDAFSEWMRAHRSEARSACLIAGERSASDALKAAREHERAGQMAARERAAARGGQA